MPVWSVPRDPEATPVQVQVELADAIWIAQSLEVTEANAKKLQQSDAGTVHCILQQHRGREKGARKLCYHCGGTDH